MPGRSITTLLLLVTLSACATTTVTKNPDDCDQGIRFYRPKPHLLLQPAGNASDEFVSISLAYLPDFSEEYSIRVRAGLGVNETKVVLTNGWNLTQIDQKLDAQFDESIKAVGDLIGKLPIPTAGKSGDPEGVRMVVRATDVPLGFYESVVSSGGDGRKRLLGWRYVGFYPMSGCPVDAMGDSFVDGRPLDVYGLVFERGVMTFKHLAQIEPEADLRREIVDRASVQRLPEPDATARPALESVRHAVLDRVRRTGWGHDVAVDQVVVHRVDGTSIAVVVTLAPRQTVRVSESLPTIAAHLEDQLRPEVRRALLDEAHQVRVDLVATDRLPP